VPEQGARRWALERRCNTGRQSERQKTVALYRDDDGWTRCRAVTLRRLQLRHTANTLCTLSLPSPMYNTAIRTGVRRRRLRSR